MSYKVLPENTTPTQHCFCYNIKFRNYNHALLINPYFFFLNQTKSFFCFLFLFSLMRFFISCFGGAADPITATKPVVLPPSRTLRRKSHWRPALGSISEETAPPHRERTAMEASAGHVKKSDNSATTKSHRRHSHDNCDYGYRKFKKLEIAMIAYSKFRYWVEKKTK